MMTKTMMIMIKKKTKTQNKMKKLENEGRGKQKEGKREPSGYGCILGCYGKLKTERSCCIAGMM